MLPEERHKPALKASSGMNKLTKFEREEKGVGRKALASDGKDPNLYEQLS